MWQRVEEKTDRCPCGEMAEMWELLSAGNRVASATFCPRCDPQLAKLVSRLKPITPQRRTREGPRGDASLNPAVRRASHAADRRKPLKA